MSLFKKKEGVTIQFKEGLDTYDKSLVNSFLGTRDFKNASIIGSEGKELDKGTITGAFKNFGKKLATGEGLVLAACLICALAIIDKKLSLAKSAQAFIKRVDSKLGDYPDADQVNKSLELDNGKVNLNKAVNEIGADLLYHKAAVKDFKGIAKKAGIDAGWIIYIDALDAAGCLRKVTKKDMTVTLILKQLVSGGLPATKKRVILLVKLASKCKTAEEFADAIILYGCNSLEDVKKLRTTLNKLYDNNKEIFGTWYGVLLLLVLELKIASMKIEEDKRYKPAVMEKIYKDIKKIISKKSKWALTLKEVDAKKKCDHVDQYNRILAYEKALGTYCILADKGTDSAQYMAKKGARFAKLSVKTGRRDSADKVSKKVQQEMAEKAFNKEVEEGRNEAEATEKAEIEQAEAKKQEKRDELKEAAKIKIVTPKDGLLPEGTNLDNVDFNI